MCTLRLPFPPSCPSPPATDQLNPPHPDHFDARRPPAPTLCRVSRVSRGSKAGRPTVPVTQAIVIQPNHPLAHAEPPQRILRRTQVVRGGRRRHRLRGGCGGSSERVRRARRVRWARRARRVRTGVSHLLGLYLELQLLLKLFTLLRPLLLFLHRWCRWVCTGIQVQVQVGGDGTECA